MNKCVKHAMLLRVALCINVTIPTYTMQVYGSRTLKLKKPH